MSTDRLLGLVITALGGLLLLINVDVLSWKWVWQLVRLWPLVVIAFGFYLIFYRTKYRVLLPALYVLLIIVAVSLLMLRPDLVRSSTLDLPWWHQQEGEMERAPLRLPNEFYP